MLDGSKKYKVIFPVETCSGWLGGVNYYRNLLHAISLQEVLPLEPYVYPKNDKTILAYAKKYANKDLWYYLNKLFNRKFNKNKYAKKLLNNFKIVSHANPMAFSEAVTISWIPDFQHKHLPEFFSDKECVARDEIFERFAKYSDVVLFSSEDAKKDFQEIYPNYAGSARVLHFVSYIKPEIYEITDNLSEKIVEKYSLPQKYFYLPNQFWQHKNHITVFKALKRLKDRGIEVNVLCSGSTSDYRNAEYFTSLQKYIEDNNLKDNIKILGIIELDEVYYLMRNSVAVINPSLFEGWSSTVEEVKSLGKKIILSDLDVHKEQNPPCASYFERHNDAQLADIIEEYWGKYESKPDFELEKQAREAMIPRMKKFGEEYANIVKSLIEASEKVSVGIPTYNRSNCLRNILECITKQTYTNLEIIISDNNSTDDTAQVAAEFAEKDSRIKYYKQPENIGIGANAKFLPSVATGRYFCIINDDDSVNPEYVENLYKKLKCSKADYTFGTVVLEAEDKSVIRHCPAFKALDKNYKNRCRDYMKKGVGSFVFSVFGRTQMFKDVYAEYDKNRFCEDQISLIKFLAKGKLESTNKSVYHKINNGNTKDLETLVKSFNLENVTAENYSEFLGKTHKDAILQDKYYDFMSQKERNAFAEHIYKVTANIK